MKRETTIGLFGVGLLLIQTPCLGQTHAEVTALRDLKLSEVTFKGSADTLLVDFTVDVSAVHLRKMERITITPLLADSVGNTFELNSFYLDSKMRSRSAYRDAVLDKKKQKPTYQTVYSYHQILYLLPWMEQAKLLLRSSIDCCGNNSSSYSKTLAERFSYELPAQRYTMQSQVNFLTPAAEPIKNRMESGKAKLEFLGGKSTILPTYKNNRMELEGIGKAIIAIRQDSTATINSILLRAYSSPEGTYASNEKLSAARSTALKNYLETAYNLKGIRLLTEAVAEDWIGLEQLIQESELPQKKQFLDIITQNSDPDLRERLFKTVAKGVPYRKMLTEIFPLLRRTEYQLSYSVKEFTVKQGREVFKTHPGQLSLNEMFHVANSYGVGTAEFNEVFELAVRLFPQDPVANINAAAVAVLRSDTTTASKFLSRVKEDPRAQNNLAALYMLTNQLEEAKACLDKAATDTQAIPQLRHNALEIERKEKDNALFDKYSRRK